MSVSKESSSDGLQVELEKNREGEQGSSPSWSSVPHDTDCSSNAAEDEDDDCVIIKTIIRDKNGSTRKNNTPIDSLQQSLNSDLNNPKLVKRAILKLKKLIPIRKDADVTTKNERKHLKIKKSKLQPIFDNSSKDDDQQRRCSSRLRKLKQNQKAMTGRGRENGCYDRPYRSDDPPRKKLKGCCSSSSGSCNGSCSSGSGSDKDSSQVTQQSPQPRVNTRSATRRMWTVGCVYRAPSPEHSIPRRYWPVDGMHERPVWPDPRYQPQSVAELRRSLHESFHLAVSYSIQVLSAAEQKEDCNPHECPIKLFLDEVDPSEEGIASNISSRLGQNSKVREKTNGTLLTSNDSECTQSNIGLTLSTLSEIGDMFRNNLKTASSVSGDPDKTVGFPKNICENMWGSRVLQNSLVGDNYSGLNGSNIPFELPVASSTSEKTVDQTTRNVSKLDEKKIKKERISVDGNEQIKENLVPGEHGDNLVYNKTVNGLSEIQECNVINYNLRESGSKKSMACKSKGGEEGSGYCCVSDKDERRSDLNKSQEDYSGRNTKSPESLDVDECKLDSSNPSSKKNESPSFENLLELIYFTAILYCTLCNVSPRSLADYLDAANVLSFMDYVQDTIYKR